MVLLVLISTYFETSSAKNIDIKGLERLLQKVHEAREISVELENKERELLDQIEKENRSLVEIETLLLERKKQNRQIEERLAEVSRDVQGLKLVSNSLESSKSITQSADSLITRDEEVGGIPVDNDYVVFIVDTSGSMQEIWPRVTRELENVIRIHPRIKGFQVINDNGIHLLSGYEGRWIPDTDGRRESVIRLFQNWVSFSNSSPVEGLEVALRRYVKRNSNVSIYIFGDEYSGPSYDPIIKALLKLNLGTANGEQLARVHAVGFISEYSTGRFATLMREVTLRTNGTFLALPQ